jgi:hypothetical protein
VEISEGAVLLVVTSGVYKVSINPDIQSKTPSINQAPIILDNIYMYRQKYTFFARDISILVSVTIHRYNTGNLTDRSPLKLRNYSRPAIMQIKG